MRDSVVVIQLEVSRCGRDVNYVCRSCGQYKCVKTARAQTSLQNNGHEYQPEYKENLYYWLCESL